MSTKLITVVVLILIIWLNAVIVFKYYSRQKAKYDLPIINNSFGKLTREFRWFSGADKTNYSEISWSKITTGRLNGFKPGFSLTEIKTEGCSGRDGIYLRVEGGLCLEGVILEVKSDNRIFKIDSFEKLRQLFAPVEDEAEAVSFVAAVKADLRIIGDVPEGHILKIPDGFLVEVVLNNTFGCKGEIPPPGGYSTGEIYRISASGDIQNIAFEEQKEGSGQILCVD